MNSDKTLAWIVLLIVVAAVYYPMVARLYRQWKISRAKKRHPSALLGVAYPRTNDDKDK